MKIKVEIDTRDLLMFTTSKEDKEFASEFLTYASDDDLIQEFNSRGLLSDVIDELSDKDKDSLFGEYGYVKQED